MLLQSIIEKKFFICNVFTFTKIQKKIFLIDKRSLEKNNET